MSTKNANSASETEDRKKFEVRKLMSDGRNKKGLTDGWGRDRKRLRKWNKKMEEG